MPILKLEIFQNSKSQKCKLWGQPPPFLEKVYILNFFYDGFPKYPVKYPPHLPCPQDPRLRVTPYHGLVVRGVGPGDRGDYACQVGPFPYRAGGFMIDPPPLNKGCCRGRQVGRDEQDGFD